MKTHRVCRKIVVNEACLVEATNKTEAIWKARKGNFWKGSDGLGRRRDWETLGTERVLEDSYDAQETGVRCNEMRNTKENEIISYLLGFLTQEQVNDAINEQGLGGVKHVLAVYGWDWAYKWPEAD